MKLNSFVLIVCALFLGGSWANVQPHSGAQANAAVMLATLNPGDSILGLVSPMVDTFHMDLPVNLSGLYYDAHFYGVQKETGRIDMDDVERIAQVCSTKANDMWGLCLRPRLGLCTFSRDCR